MSSETARLHHAARQRGSRMAARGAGTAGRAARGVARLPPGPRSGRFNRGRVRRPEAEQPILSDFARSALGLRRARPQAAVKAARHVSRSRPPGRAERRTAVEGGDGVCLAFKKEAPRERGSSRRTRSNVRNVRTRSNEVGAHSPRRCDGHHKMVDWLKISVSAQRGALARRGYRDCCARPFPGSLAGR